MRLNSSFLLLSRCLFNSKNKPVCQEHPENLNVHLLLIIRLIFNSTKITFFNIVWDTPSITVTSILYFTSISTFSGGLTKSLSISFSSTPPFLLSLAWICHNRNKQFQPMHQFDISLLPNPFMP